MWDSPRQLHLLHGPLSSLCFIMQIRLLLHRAFLEGTTHLQGWQVAEGELAKQLLTSCGVPLLSLAAHSTFREREFRFHSSLSDSPALRHGRQWEMGSLESILHPTQWPWSPNFLSLQQGAQPPGPTTAKHHSLPHCPPWQFRAHPRLISHGTHRACGHTSSGWQMWSQGGWCL